MKYTTYADLFHGSGTIHLPAPQGIAASWHFIKALCGNTHPGASLPFGKYTVSPYSAGYSAGYGVNSISCGGRVPPLLDKLRLLGFSHFQDYGTGAIGLYYNYAVVTPYDKEHPCRKDGQRTYYEIENETAEPGYYAVTLPETGIFCELTAGQHAAYHQYTFPRAGGRIAIDFTNDGLYDENTRGKAENPTVARVSDRELRAAVTLQGVRMFFCVRVYGEGAWEDDVPPEQAVFRVSGAGSVLLTLSVSASSMADAALDAARALPDFDLTRDMASEIWEKALGRVEIETEDENERKLFYTCLYDSLLKPCDWGGGGFLWTGAPFVVDFCTMWDMYKTSLPLLYTLYPKISEQIVAMFRKLGETYGKIPHCFMLTTCTTLENKQARLNADHSLYDAWIRGIPGDWEGVYRQMKADIFREEYRDFTENGRCEKTTHTLDMAEGCGAAAEMAEALGHPDDAAQLRTLAAGWKNAFDPETGLLHEKSSYYEGNHWNYSFRPLRQMDERIAMAGGPEKMEALLDRFFGYTHPEDTRARFEGFNNETDMEAPYAYAAIGRQEKLSDILTAADRYMFRTAEGGTGRGGIPGNNDSGGLTSCYIFNCLGIFPVSGQNKFFLTRPKFARTVLHLSSGRTLTICRTGDGAYLQTASCNGIPCPDLTIRADVLMQGGELLLGC